MIVDFNMIRGFLVLKDEGAGLDAMYIQSPPRLQPHPRGQQSTELDPTEFTILHSAERRYLRH